MPSNNQRNNELEFTPTFGTQHNLRDFEKISTIEYIANSEIIPSIEYNDQRPTNDHIYAVLINGVNTSGSELWFWNELSAMFTTLVYEYGTPRDHITVLSTDATNANNFVFNHEGIQYRGCDLDFRRESSTPSNDIQYSCTTSNLTSVFTSLGNELGSDDVVYVYLTGHGEVGNDQFIFRTWDNDMILASEFNSLLDNLNDCKQVVIVATGCKSGYLINGSVPITGHNRTIVTSCNMLEDEHAEVWITPVPNDPSGFSLTSGYGEFAYYFISALRGKYPARENIGDNDAILINQPWANGPLVGSYNFPMAPPPPSPHPADIDYRYLRENYWNNSGEPLLFRAYQYADIWNTMSDQELMEEGLALLTNQPNYLMVHPSINPAYRTHPQYHSNGCLYRDRQTLDNVNLDLNGYEIRDRLSFYDQPISLIGSLSVSGSEACLNLEDNSTLIMTPSSEISVVYGRIDVNHSIVTMQTSAVLNLEKASATFDHSRLNMNSSSTNMRSSSSILFTNNSLLHAVSGANGSSQITGNAPATYVENVVNAGTNYANHIGSETLVRGDFVEFRNSIFETYGSDTHRFRIKSNQTQDPDNPTFWDGVYFYDCEQDFIDNPFQYVNFEYLDKISFNNCDFTLDHCNISNSGQLVVENNSSVQVLGSSYSTNDGPIYVSHSAIDIQSSQINNNRLGGVYLNYPRTSQGNNWISDSTISNNGLHGIRTSNCFLNLLRTSITNNDGQGLYNFSIVTSRIMNGVHLGDNAGAEIFSTDVGFPIFYAPLDNDNIVNQIIDDNYIEDSLDKFYLMALGAPQDGSIHLLNTSLNHNNPERFYPSINCYTFYDTLLPASRILANAMTLLAANEYPACMDSLKHILDIYPGTKEAKTALGLLPYVDKAINSDNTSLIQYLDNLSDEFLDDAIIDSKILCRVPNVGVNSNSLFLRLFEGI